MKNKLAASLAALAVVGLVPWLYFLPTNVLLAVVFGGFFLSMVVAMFDGIGQSKKEKRRRMNAAPSPSFGRRPGS